MLLFAVIQSWMFMSLLFHPLVLGWIVTQLWRIISFRRKKVLGELSIKGVHIFSLTVSGCRLKLLSGVQLNIEWAGIRIKLKEILSPCEVWFDGVRVIEIKDGEREHLQRCHDPRWEEEDKPSSPPQHERADPFIMPGYVIWLLTTIKIAISHLVLEAGDHRVDVAHTNISANFVPKLNCIISVIYLDTVKFQDKSIGFYGTLTGFLFKSEIAMRRHERHLLLNHSGGPTSREWYTDQRLDYGPVSYSIFTPMEMSHIESASTVLTCLRTRVVVRDNYPRQDHQPPKQQSEELASLTTAASSIDEPPSFSLPLSLFAPRLLCVCISDVHVLVSAEHGTIPSMCLFIDSEPGGEMAPDIKGTWALSVNREVGEDGMQQTIPSVVVECDVSTVVVQCNHDESLSFQKIHFAPLLDVHEKEGGFNPFYVRPAVLKGSVQGVSGHIGHHLASWIELHERWERDMHRRKGAAQIARLAAGLPPIDRKKFPISFVINSADVLLDEPKSVSGLYTIDTGGVPDKFQHHYRAFIIEVREEVVFNSVTGDRVVEINVHIEKIFIAVRKALAMSLDTYVTSTNCELEVECQQFSVKRVVKRMAKMVKASVTMNLASNTAKMTERVHPIFERRLCQAEDLKIRHHKILLTPGGKYGQGIPLAKPTVDVCVTMDTMELEWSGRTHVSFFRLIKRLPLTIDYILGVPKDIHPSYLQHRIVVSRRLVVHVVPSSTLERRINKRMLSGYIELQVETSKFDLSINTHVIERSGVAPTQKNVISVIVDDVAMLLPSSHQSGARRDSATVEPSLIASSLGVCDVNSVLPNHHRAAAEAEVGGKEQPNAYVPVLHARKVKVSQQSVDTDVQLDSLGFEISGKRTVRMSSTFSSIDVTLPPEVQFGDIIENMTVQYQIAEALIPERERTITVVASTTNYDFHNMTLICSEKQHHEAALTLEPHVTKNGEIGWGATAAGSLSRTAKRGVLAMALQRLEYEVDRSEPVEETQSFIQSLDSHDASEAMTYQNIQGGRTNLKMSNYAAWVAGCSVPIVEFDSLCLSGVLLRASLDVGPRSHSSYQLRLSTPPDHPFQGHPCNSGTSIEFDTMPEKTYMDVLLGMDGLEVLYGRCLEPAIGLAGKAFSRLQSHSNHRKQQDASVSLCSSKGPSTTTTVFSSSLSPSSLPPRSSLKNAKAPPSTFTAWDNLRCNFHGHAEMNVSSSTFTYLLAPASQAHNINLFDSVRIMSESVTLTYILGQFEVDLLRWVVSIPGVRNEAQAKLGQRQQQQQQSVNSNDDEGDSIPQFDDRSVSSLESHELEDSPPFDNIKGGRGGVVPPKLQSKKQQARKMLSDEAVYGPRHCAVFLPHVTIIIKVTWDCRSGHPFWHHFSSELDEQLKDGDDITQPPQPRNKWKNSLPLVESYDDFRATGIYLDIELDTSSMSLIDDIGEVIWLAFRMDALERMSLMDDYYDVLPGRIQPSPHVGKRNRCRTSSRSQPDSTIGTATAAEGLDADDMAKSRQSPLVRSLNMKVVLQGLSLIVWRGVSHTSDGFLLNVRYCDCNACGISADESNEILSRGPQQQPMYLEARMGHSTVDLVNVSSILSDWERSFECKKLLPFHQSPEEANAWQLVILLQKIDAKERGQHILSSLSTLFRQGKLTEYGLDYWDALNDSASSPKESESQSNEVPGGSSSMLHEPSRLSVQHFFHLLRERKQPSSLSLYQAECLMRTSRIVPSIANDDYDDMTETTENDCNNDNKSPDSRMRNVKFSGAARAVVIIDQLRLLWTLPIRDSIVLLVGDVLEQLARRRARLHRRANLDMSSTPNALQRTDSVDSGLYINANECDYPNKSATPTSELPLQEMVLHVESSRQESQFDMLDWLKQIKENIETPVSTVENDSPSEVTPLTLRKTTESVNTTSPPMLSENNADVSPSFCERTPTPRMEEPAALSSFRHTCSSNRGTIGDQSSQRNTTSQNRRHARKPHVNDSVIDYEVQLIAPQVKLHGAKSSVILSIFRASAQAVTLKTLVSTKQHEESQTVPRSASQYSHNGPVERTSTETVDCNSFDTALDDSRVASPHCTATQLSPISTESHKHLQHDASIPSTPNPHPSSEHTPVVLRQKSINVKFQGAWVYALPEAEHGLSEWAAEEEDDDEDIDVEFSFGLPNRTGKLSKVMRRFNLTADYQFCEQMSIDELRAIAEKGTKLPLKHVDRRPCTKMLLYVPTLVLVVESEQLYQILDITRNLLLAAPTQESLKRSQERSNKRKKKKQVVTVGRSRAGTGGVQIIRTNTPESSTLPRSGAESGTQNSKTQKNRPSLDVVNRHDRQIMRSGVENFLQAFHSGTLYPGGGGVVEAVRVEYYIGRCVCRLMMSPQYILSEGITDKVEMGMTGFGAKHSYMSVGNASAVYQDVLIQVERFWINNLTPGPEACENFEDASSILGSVLPVQHTCQRCGIHFEPDQNRLKSCRFHGFEDGTQGCFAHEQGFSGLHWTCCGASQKDAPGCVTRPHVPKEIMLCLRAEGCPPVLVGGMDIHVFKHVEVNMFPSASYSIVLQLTKGVATMLQRYFELDEYKDALEDENEIELSNQVARVPCDVGGDANDTAQQPPIERHQQQLRHSKKKGKKDDEEGGSKHDKSPPDVVYTKYIRLGDINLNVSVQGFKYLNLDEYSVAVKPFVRWRKIGTGSRMLRKLIWHITRSVTSHVLKPHLFRSPAEDESKKVISSFLIFPTLPRRKKTPKKQTDKSKATSSSGTSKDRHSGLKIKLSRPFSASDNIKTSGLESLNVSARCRENTVISGSSLFPSNVCTPPHPHNQKRNQKDGVG